MEKGKRFANNIFAKTMILHRACVMNMRANRKTAKIDLMGHN